MIYPLKQFLKKILRLFHSFLHLDVLSQKEKDGKIDTMSSLKFIKKSFHNLPFKLGLTIRGVHFNGIDPFCRALRYRDNEINKQYFLSTLNNELFNQKDMTVNDFLPSNKNFEFNNFPIYTFAYPWDSHTFEDFNNNYLDLVIENRKEHSHHESLGLKKEQIYSNEFSLSHFFQFKKLLKSIKKNGFIYNDDRPRVLILKSGKKWKWIMSGQGNHRAYLLSMLNYENFPCEVIKIVDRDFFKTWPNVRNGVYSEEYALKIFDLVFSGTRILKGIV